MTDLPVWLQHFEENCKKNRVSFVLAPESTNLNNLLLECIKHSVARWRVEQLQNLTDTFEVQDICSRYMHLHTKMHLHDEEVWNKASSHSWSKIKKSSTYKVIKDSHIIKACVYSHYSNESSILEFNKALTLSPKLSYENEQQSLQNVLIKELQMINKFAKKYGDINA